MLEVEWSNALCRKHSRQQDLFCDIYRQKFERNFANTFYGPLTMQRHLLVRELLGFSKTITACYFSAGSLFINFNFESNIFATFI